MNLTTIDMPIAEARAMRREYWAAMRKSGDPEDKSIYLMARELAKGRRIVNVADAILDAGVNEKGFPNLAIARANWRFCWFHEDSMPGTNWQTRGWFFQREAGIWPRPGKFNVEHVSTRQRETIVTKAGKALVPSIPPRLRPAGNLHRFHILWEAEWEEVAPVDPILLKRIQGDYFAVLAQWDLTEIERAVLAMRGKG